MNNQGFYEEKTYPPVDTETCATAHRWLAPEREKQVPFQRLYEEYLEYCFENCGHWLQFAFGYTLGYATEEPHDTES
jgi:hypothetical protein